MKRRNRIKMALRRGLARTFVVAPVVFLLVAGAGCPSLFESTTHRATHIRQAVPGKDLDKHVTAADTVVNAYAALAGADQAAGATTLTVANITTLAANFTGPLSQGDLLLIVQMAGATVDFTTNDSSDYGAFATTDLGSAGRYELVGVEGVNAASNQITLACPLKNAYTVAGKTQVIRVPQYLTLTIDSGASITAPAWNGTTGGVVAVHAETTLELDGSIDVSAKGFRGGSTVGDDASRAAGTLVTLYRSTFPADGAEKGEGIAGYQGDYTNGRYGRGAPANGGGGGNSHNAGGGGGANAGDLAAWNNGQGVMSGTFTPDPWRLDPGYTSNGGARTNAQGGGRGGYSYSANDSDALAVAPGDSAWGGDDRREAGGLGGRPVPNDPASRLFVGGGGGAGDGNDGIAGPGGNGGGLVFLIAGSVTGTGNILADGGAGGNSVFAGGAGGDAPGGGGGGGTVVVHATSLGAISISVKGGNGGTQVGSSDPNEVEGPGGGGGGGYVAVSGGAPTMVASGGLSGTTDRAAMTEFPADGATAGHAGLTNGSASTFLYCGTTTAPVTTIETFPPDHSKNATGTFTFTNTESPVTYQCSLNGGTTWASCNASYTTPTLADGSHTLSVRSTDLSGNVEDPPATHTWVIDTVPPVTTIETHPTDPSSSPTGNFTFTNSESAVTYECKLDSGAWAACNAGAPSSASYTTGILPDGSHTLSVRSTDQAGNLEQGPPYVSFPWTVQAGALDAGAYDAEGALDSGAVEVPPALEDAEGIDALANEDDVAAPDLAADKILVVGDDTAPVVGLDATVDVEKQDVLPLFLDAGDALDTKTLADGLSADVLADAQSFGAEPNPDTAGPVVNDDAAPPPANEDAAPVVPPATEDLKILGSGFCAIASPRSTSSMPFLVMALAALALLGRRRKQ